MSDVPQVIREIAEKIGTTAEAAWPLYVQYVWAEGVTNVVVGSASLLVLCVGAAIAARFWFGREHHDSDDMWFPPLMAAMILGMPVGFSVAAIVSGLPPMLAPAGAAIHEVVGKVTK